MASCSGLIWRWWARWSSPPLCMCRTGSPEATSTSSFLSFGLWGTLILGFITWWTTFPGSTWSWWRWEWLRWTACPAWQGPPGHRGAESTWGLSCISTESWGSSTCRHTLQSYWEVTISSTFTLSTQLPTSLPVIVLQTGLCVDYQGQTVLDNYNTMMAVTSTICLDLLVFSSACKTGDLVKVEGIILRVDKEASLQWMEDLSVRQD